MRLRTDTASLRFPILASLSILLCIACAETVSRIESPARIIVRTNTGNELHRITDPASLAGITRFINARTDGWRTPLAGVPVPTVILDCYTGDAFTGHFGIARDCFTLHRSGQFLSRSASPAELNEALHLAGVR